MSKNLIESIILLVIAIILIIIYGIFVIIDERKQWNKRKFFKYTLYYEVDYLLYMDMVVNVNLFCRVLVKSFVGFTTFYIHRFLQFYFSIIIYIIIKDKFHKTI